MLWDYSERDNDKDRGILYSYVVHSAHTDVNYGQRCLWLEHFYLIRLIIIIKIFYKFFCFENGRVHSAASVLHVLGGHADVAVGIGPPPKHGHS